MAHPIPAVSPAVLSHDAGMHTCRCGADTTRSMWDPYGDIYATILFINFPISHWLSKDLVLHVHVLSPPVTNRLYLECIRQRDTRDRRRPGL